MPTATHNHDEEYYAKQVLEEYCGFSRGDLYVSDRPDIQSKKESVGIEVVQAIPSGWKRRENQLQYCKGDINLLNEENRKLFDNDKEVEFKFGGSVRIFTANVEYDKVQAKKLIREQLEYKLIKSRKYIKLDSLQLFIFVRECLTFSDEDLHEIQEILSPGMETFPVIYVCSRTHLWTFINNTISHVYITNHNELFEDAIREEELEAVNNCIDENGISE